MKGQAKYKALVFVFSVIYSTNNTVLVIFVQNSSNKGGISVNEM